MIGAVTYTISPVHTDDHFVQKAMDLVALGVDAVEIKDPSGLLTPERAAHLIPAIRKATPGVELQLHSHCTLGHGLDTYLEALKLGAQGVDLMHCASRPLAYGYSLPSYDAILDALPEYRYAPAIDRAVIDEMQAYFTMITRRSGRPEGKVLPVQSVDEGHQVPGGMMSNLVQQLSDQGQAHRLPEVLDEIVRIREDLGYPILVSPMAQYVGTQGVLNVLSGKRYQMVPQEIKQYVLGYYGKVVGKIKPEVRELIAGDEPEITVPPGQLIEPMMPRYRRELAPYGSDEELALKIFYSAKVVEENRRARLNVRQWTHATNAAALLAKELLGRKDIEICEVRKKDFYFSMNQQEDQAA
jgi:pyruvate/oxaloacetate carboxyltransferase